ncbi:XdhC family protein [Streptomyces sp. NPDC002588]|uniref:XdhC family protein n=1 Tax=Streptomyces sp. NPDC002588 TaxID=3154419 RepID=UPI003329F29E
MRELARTAREWAREGRTAVLARPVTEKGFGPKRPADALLVDAGPGGQCRGSLYRGAADRRLAEEAAALVSAGHTARIRAVAVHDEAVKEAGLTCGGQAEILLQALHTIPVRWWELMAEGADAALVTRLDGERTRARSTVVTPAAADPATPPRAVESARRLLARHRAGRELLDTGTGPLLVESCPAVPHLLVVGGGELADLLVAQAGLLGWRATVTESSERVRELIAGRPAALCLVVLSHEPGVDVPALYTALTTGVPYVGALGSRHTQDRRAAALRAAGLDEEHLRRVHGPIGLDLGARTPAETALAICAEILTTLAAAP